MEEVVAITEECTMCDFNEDNVEDGEKEEEDEFEDAAGLKEDGTADHR